MRTRVRGVYSICMNHHTLISTIALSLVALPLTSFAYTNTIHSVSESVTDTGSVTVSNGQIISTGDSGASVTQTTHMNSVTGGTSTVTIETDSGGRHTSETTIRVIPPGITKISTRAATSTRARVGPRTKSPRLLRATTTIGTSVAASASVSPEAMFTVASLRDFLNQILSVFGW